MVVLRGVLAIFGSILFASQALAQQVEPDQKQIFAAYVNSSVYRGYLEQVFNSGEPAILKAECSAMKIVEYNGTLMLEQPTFVQAAANYRIEKGSWIARAVLDRCGSRVTRRALLKAIPGANQLTPTLLLPGDFRGDLRLEADAVRIVIPSLMAFAKCRDLSTFHVLNVVATVPSSPSGPSETWSATACDKKIDADVTYTKVGNGVNISAGNWKVH